MHLGAQVGASLGRWKASNVSRVCSGPARGRSGRRGEARAPRPRSALFKVSGSCAWPRGPGGWGGAHKWPAESRAPGPRRSVGRPPGEPGRAAEQVLGAGAGAGRAGAGRAPAALTRCRSPPRREAGSPPCSARVPLGPRGRPGRRRRRPLAAPPAPGSLRSAAAGGPDARRPPT